MNITKIDRNAHSFLSAEVANELRALGELHGLSFEVQGGQYSDAGFGHFKVAVNVNGGESRDEVDFKSAACLFGLEPTDFGGEFVSNGTTYTMCGLSCRSPKYPLRGKRADGKIYKFTRAVIDSYVARKAEVSA